MTIVPDAFGLVRELIPNSSAHLILRPQLPTQPAPGHESGQMDAVFAQVLPPPEGYFYSDHAGFVEPASAPVHVLEAALESGARRHGEFVLWRGEGTPFDQHDEEDLERVAGYFEQALRHAPELGAGGAGVIEDEAMLLATSDGQILYLSAAPYRPSACAWWNRWCTATATRGCCRSGPWRWAAASSKRAPSG
jgi:hypothetical protein